MFFVLFLQCKDTAFFPNMQQKEGLFLHKWEKRGEKKRRQEDGRGWKRRTHPSPPCEGGGGGWGGFTGGGVWGRW
jgi:hypothetical protein